MMSLRRVLAAFAMLLAAAVVVFAPAAPSACAAPSTSAFDALTLELTVRRDQNYSGTLSSLQRKELAALNASLTRLDGAHATLVDDAKSAKVVIKKLLTGFKAEFSATSEGPLPGLVAGVVSNLVSLASAERDQLEAGIAQIGDAGARASATASYNAARQAIDTAAAPTTPPKTAVALLKKAATAIAKGLALVQAETGASFSMKLGARTFVANDLTASYLESAGVLTLQGRRLSPSDGPTELFVLKVTATEPGVYEILDFSIFNPSWAYYAPDELDSESIFYGQLGGTCTITSLDVVAKSVSGTFSLKLQRNGRDKITVTRGRFSVTDLTVE